MKAKTLQIIWHGKDPVLSLDFHCSGILATAGSDKEIKLWEIEVDEDGLPKVTYHSSLSHHNAAINIARFSPSGDLLATGADGGEVVVWKPVKTASKFPSWKVLKTTSFPSQDVLALEWSPDGTTLLSGSVNHKIAIWDVTKGSVECTFEDHGHYVQGVAWDPLGHFVVSQSSDRTCRVYSRPLTTQKLKGKPSPNLTFQHVLSKGEYEQQQTTPVTDTNSLPNKVSQTKFHLFHDENLPSFFRRLAWSPDGSFFVIPAGVHKKTSGGTVNNTSYIYSRADVTRPAMHLPTGGKPTVAVRFCPIIFALLPTHSSEESNGLGHENECQNFSLSYRLVFAVATLNSVILYDSQKIAPIALIGGLHFATITDLAWSPDARFLAISSQDGYCTIVVFDAGELGTPLSKTELVQLGVRQKAHKEETMKENNPPMVETVKEVKEVKEVSVNCTSETSDLPKPAETVQLLSEIICISGSPKRTSTGEDLGEATVGTETGQSHRIHSPPICDAPPLENCEDGEGRRTHSTTRKRSPRSHENCTTRTVKVPRRITPTRDVS